MNNEPQITKELVQTICTELDKAAKEIGAKYGVDIRLGGMSLSGQRAFMNIEVSAPGAPSKEAVRYDSMAFIHNLPPRGSQVTLDGTDFKVVGMKQDRMGRDVVQIERISDSSTFLCHMDTIKMAYYSSRQKLGHKKSHG